MRWQSAHCAKPRWVLLILIRLKIPIASERPFNGGFLTEHLLGLDHQQHFHFKTKSEIKTFEKKLYFNCFATGIWKNLAGKKTAAEMPANYFP